MTENEEKYLEAAIIGDGDDIEYLRAFNAAKEASWQRSGGKITQCEAATLAVLKQYFVLRKRNDP